MMKVWIKALRVSQWTKNAVVFAAWFFAVGDASQAALARGFRPFLLVCAMAASFSFVSSAFYLLNDVADYDADRRHPVKKLRPVAADLVSKISAVRCALALFAFGLAFPCYLVLRHPDRTWGFAVVLIYAVMQCAYSGFLKRVPYLDVMVIASGFVLRAVAGAAVLGAMISPWLLVCTFSLALFLGLCKRRHEKDVEARLESGGGTTRHSLAGYHPSVLNVMIVAVAVMTVVVYLLYTRSPDTVAKFGARVACGLQATSVFVVAGIVRYLALLWGKGDVGRPEKVLLSDRVLWLILGGWALSVFAVFFWWQ